MADGRVGWNIDPVTKKPLTKADALARGLRPPEKQPKPPPSTEPATPATPPPPPTDTTQMSGARSNVLPFGPRVTLGDALKALSAPASSPSLGSPPGPAGMPTATPALEGTPIRPPLSPAPPSGGALVPQPESDSDSFADLGGKVGASVAQAVIGWAISRQGYAPNEPDDDDVEQLERGVAKGIRLKLGDAPMPWWGPILAALALMYLSMRTGAKKLKPEAPADAPIIRAPAPAAATQVAPAPATQVAPPSSPPPPGGTPPRPPPGKPGPIAPWSQAA